MGVVLHRPRWPALILLLAGLMLALSGCIGVRVSRDGVTIQASRQSPGDVGDGRHQVPLLVVQGPQGATLALVPVYINGQGPFPFALDTGASRSVVDRQLVDQLGLEVGGPAGEATGIAGTTPSRNLDMTDWRIGDVKLPARTIATIELLHPKQGQGPQGLIGSDILSGFGVIVVDYEQGVLTLGPRQDGTPAPAAGATPGGSPTP